MRDPHLSPADLAPVSTTDSLTSRDHAADGSAARERRLSNLRNYHRAILAVAIVVIAASFLLRRSGSETLALAWPKIELPPICPSRAFFNVECPACGLTRSFVALAAGDIEASWDYHRLGWLLALAVVAQIPYRLFALRRLRETRSPVQPIWPKLFVTFLVAALILNWLLKLAGV